MEEPKGQLEVTADNWGREPLRKVSQGHYGLGLNRVRAIIEAHGGKMYARYDPERFGRSLQHWYCHLML